MADNTSKMIALLGAMRKQMNGAVADAMYYYGERYGLNYGVSLPTIRSIAKEYGKQHDLALYLCKQQVRELRLAALHIASAEEITTEEIGIWEQGVNNSEMAEEIAFAMIPNTAIIDEIYSRWSSSQSEYLCYAALMTAAREKSLLNRENINKMAEIVERFPSSRIIAQGCVACLATAATIDNPMREHIKTLLTTLPQTATAEHIKEEMEWRLEF